MFCVGFPLFQFKRWLCRALVDGTLPILGDRGCHRCECTTGPLSLRFPVEHVADHQVQYVFLNHQPESLESAASSYFVQLEAAVLPLGRPSRSKGGCARLVGCNHSQCQITLEGTVNVSLLRHTIFGIGGSPSCSTKDGARCFQPATAACLGTRELVTFFAQHPIQSFQNRFFRPL